MTAKKSKPVPVARFVYPLRIQDAELWRKAKSTAALKGQTMLKFIEGLLQEAVK